MDPKGTQLPRTTLEFRLSGPSVRQNLLHEFSLHQDVTATAGDTDQGAILRVETSSAAGAVWDVRATVGMFDDGAVEIKPTG